MNKKIYNVSSARVARYLYALGFDKESYVAPSGKENWRFQKSQELEEAMSFFYRIRDANRRRLYAEGNINTECVCGADE